MAGRFGRPRPFEEGSEKNTENLLKRTKKQLVAVSHHFLSWKASVDSVVEFSFRPPVDEGFVIQMAGGILINRLHNNVITLPYRGQMIDLQDLSWRLGVSCTKQEEVDRLIDLHLNLYLLEDVSNKEATRLEAIAIRLEAITSNYASIQNIWN